MIRDRATFARSLGIVLVVLLGVQAVTGVALATVYSPSTANAWGSVAYLQDQLSLGWLVRGMHYHGGSAMVIVAGLHLVHTAITGSYKRPRELVWWLGVALLVLLLAWSVTGYWLRWDQSAFWAAKVELGIMGGAPVVGGAIQKLAMGGNDLGTLTLTRAYAIHIFALPVIFAGAAVGHILLALRHRGLRMEGATRRWPEQSTRDALAVAIVLATLSAYVVWAGGVALGPPADPGQAFDARPLWTFRWLFELRNLAGAGERIAALTAPAIVIGFLFALPVLDRGPDVAPRRRLVYLVPLSVLLALIAGLTASSLLRDRSDEALQVREQKMADAASRARRLARTYGIPASGPLDLDRAPPFARARMLYTQHCAGCHDATSKTRKGPVIAPGHGDRAWLAGFLKEPSEARYWGATKLATTDRAMKPVEQTGRDLSDLVEMLHAQSGASDVDAAARDRGIVIFDATCTDCHTREEGVSATAPALAGLGSRDYYRSFIANPKSGLHMGATNSQMPRFSKELTVGDEDELANYLSWLGSATPAAVNDLEAL